ncbi:MAG: CPBP family intramembrane metalloprotease [Clostridia bacterium]|nr:CPBP family intramembrane metalloprotease [Clostridia bacterium]
MGKKQHSLLFTTGIIYFVILLLFVGVRIIVQVVDFPISAEILDYIASGIIQIGFMFLLPIVAFSLMQKQKVKKTFTDFGYAKINLKSILVCILIGFFCYFLNILISSFFGTIIRLCGYENPPSSATGSVGDYSVLAFILNVITVAILPAVCEETTHRGLLLKGFSTLGIKKAIIFSSLLFGLMHLNINQFFYATVLGFIIALTVIISKNIFPAIIIHFMNNFLSVYFDFARHNNWFGKGLYEFFTTFLYSENFISFFITNCLVLVVLLFTIVFLFTILLKETRIKKVNNMLTDIAQINKEFNEGDPVYQNDPNLANLHNLNNLMKQYNIKSLNSMVFTDLEMKERRKSTLFEILLLVSCFVVSGLVTAFTFIWGII